MFITHSYQTISVLDTVTGFYSCPTCFALSGKDQDVYDPAICESSKRLLGERVGCEDFQTVIAGTPGAGGKPRWVCPPKGSTTAAPSTTSSSKATTTSAAAPSGTTTKAPCPAGTFWYSLDNVCRKCIPGVYCPCVGVVWSSGFSDPKCNIECPVDNYCPEGSAAPVPCPTNAPFTTFTKRTGASLVTQCDLFPTCSPGYYWDIGSCKICLAGTYMDESTGSTHFPDCKICPPNFFCVEGSKAPTSCSTANPVSPAGSQMSRDCNAAPTSGPPTLPPLPCPAGFYAYYGRCAYCPGKLRIHLMITIYYLYLHLSSNTTKLMSLFSSPITTRCNLSCS